MAICTINQQQFDVRCLLEIHCLEIRADELHTCVHQGNISPSQPSPSLPASYVVLGVCVRGVRVVAAAAK